MPGFCLKKFTVGSQFFLHFQGFHLTCPRSCCKISLSFVDHSKYICWWPTSWGTGGRERPPRSSMQRPAPTLPFPSSLTMLLWHSSGLQIFCVQCTAGLFPLRKRGSCWVGRWSLHNFFFNLLTNYIILNKKFIRQGWYLCVFLDSVIRIIEWVFVKLSMNVMQKLTSITGICNSWYTTCALASQEVCPKMISQFCI
jgi:hypothetical protein